jgi:hypothetical protein
VRVDPVVVVLENILLTRFYFLGLLEKESAERVLVRTLWTDGISDIYLAEIWRSKWRLDVQTQRVMAAKEYKR